MSKRTREMMEVVTGYPSDVVALNWHKKLDENDVRRDLSLSERDLRAGKHDLRLLAKLLPFSEKRHKTLALAQFSGSAGQWRDIERIAVVTDDLITRIMIQFFGPFYTAQSGCFPMRRAGVPAPGWRVATFAIEGRRREIPGAKRELFPEPGI
jgi:SpoIIAA-like